MKRILSALLAVLLLSAPAAAQTFTLPWQASVVGSSQPGLANTPLFLWNGFSGSTFDPAATLRVDRDVETTSGGGQSWWTYKAFWANTTTSFVSPGFEWTITGELYNRSRKSTNAQNVAGNFTAWKQPTDNGEETTTTWASNFNCVDQTNIPNPTTSCVGSEINVGGGVGTDNNRQRVGVHVALGGQPGSHAGYGVVVSPTPGVTIDRAFSTANVNGSFGIGLDLAGGSFSGAAILMAPGQWIGLDGTTSGSFGHFIGFYNNQLVYMTPGGPMLRFSDDGAVYLGRVIEQIPHVPSSSSSPCETGEHAWDQSYEYRCVSTNHWKRAGLSDF